MNELSPASFCHVIFLKTVAEVEKYIYAAFCFLYIGNFGGVFISDTLSI